MTKASATFYALIITLLIGLLCSGLILFVLFNDRSTNLFLNKTELQQRVNDVARIVSGSDDFPKCTFPMEVKEFSDNNFQINYTKFNWGIYWISNIEGKFGLLSYSRSVLAGSSSGQCFPNTLYLANRHQPLLLSGNTLLKGTLCISETGIKLANFDAVGFTREKLYEGELKVSSDSLPVTFNGLYKANINLSHGKFLDNDSVIKVTDVSGHVLKQSFSNPTIVLYFEDTARLANTSLSGNIIVYSEKSILITEHSKLSGVILISPDISVGARFTGDCQLISNDQIMVHKEAKLNYPSAIIHLDDGNHERLSQAVFIDSLATITGSVFMLSANPTKATSLLTVESDAMITGAVYSVSRVDLKGKIYGAIYSYKFVSVTPYYYKEGVLDGSTIEPDTKFNYFSGPRPDNLLLPSIITKWLE